MATSNRWLIVMGGALGLLTAVAVLAAVVARGRPTVEYAENTPEGVAQRYLQALLEDDTTRAYGYLAPEAKERCTPEVWDRQARYAHTQIESAEVNLKEVKTPREGEATVRITITHFNEPGPSIIPPPMPVMPPSGYDQDFFLRRQSDGTWRLVEPTWPIYCPDAAKPIAPALR